MQLDALHETVLQVCVQRGAENAKAELLGEKSMHVGVDRRGEQTNQNDRRIRLEDRRQQRFGLVERGAFQHEEHRIHDFLIRPRRELRLQALHCIACQQRAARQRRKTLRRSRDDPTKQRQTGFYTSRNSPIRTRSLPSVLQQIAERCAQRLQRGLVEEEEALRGVQAEQVAVHPLEDLGEGERGVEATERLHDELRVPAGDWNLGGQVDGEASEEIARSGDEGEERRETGGSAWRDRWKEACWPSRLAKTRFRWGRIGLLLVPFLLVPLPPFLLYFYFYLYLNFYLLNIN